MYASERQKRILELLQKDGKVEVKNLKDIFSVTEDCIRKDLNKLESEGMLVRIYGGAIMNKPNPMDKTFENRININREAKLSIAEKAFGLIKDNTTIYLDASTINLLLAEKLVKSSMKLTVVSNMIDIIPTLVKSSSLKVISCGGIANATLNSFVGAASIEFLKQFHFDQAFMGSSGLDLSTNFFTTFEAEDGITKKAVMQCSRNAYMLMEKEKFYYFANYKFAPLERFTGIITEAGPTPELENLVNHTSIELY